MRQATSVTIERSAVIVPNVTGSVAAVWTSSDCSTKVTLQAPSEAERQADRQLAQAAAQDQPRHLARLRAERHADADLDVRCVTA